jgi:exopolyphosphatase/guanosine-5'-triphosphate,3'-diphosphate pyrophosphatase
MRLGIIDLGSNSVRFDIHDLSRRERLLRERELIRLGESVFTTHQITGETASRALQAFCKFRQWGDQHEVSRYSAVGTSALRDARNKEEFIELIHRETGIRLQVISGDEEAALIAKGVMCNEKIDEGPVAIVDIGGGSTEIIIALGESVFHSRSFNLGTLRLQQVYLKTHPPKPTGQTHPLNELRHVIRSTLSSIIIREGWPPVKRVIGASGTIRALTRIGKQMGDKSGQVERDTLEKLIQQMSVMTLRELLEIPGMEQKRVDMILAGAVLVEEIIDVFRAKRIVATEFSLRDGLYLQELERYNGAAT